MVQNESQCLSVFYGCNVAQLERGVAQLGCGTAVRVQHSSVRAGVAQLGCSVAQLGRCLAH